MKLIALTLLMSLTAAKRCAPGIDIYLSQNAKVTRPMGEVIFSCMMTGVSMDEVEFYWWLIDDTNSPLYTFSETHGIEEITPSFESLAIIESQEIKENNVTSTLQLRVNITTNFVFRCEFNLWNHEICADKISVSFKEPLMNIQTDQKSTRYEELPRPAIVMDVYCSANNVADNPQITLQIKDHSHGDMLISNKTTIMKDPFGYNRVLYRAVIPAVVIGDVICLLTDSLGTFIEKQLLKAAGNCEGFHFDISDDSMALRSITNMQLTCSVDGVDISDVEYYFWRRTETMDVILVYPEHLQKKLGLIEHDAMRTFQTESHTYSDGIKSQIQIAVRAEVNITYGCLFKIHGKLCGKNVRVVLSDPEVMVTFTGDPKQTDDSQPASLTDATCTIDAAVGEPIFAMVYKGPRQSEYESIISNTTMEYIGRGFYRAIYRAVIRIPGTGSLSCTVTDAIGSYTSDKAIIKKTGHKWETRILVTLAFLGAASFTLLVAIIAIMILFIRMLRTRQVKGERKNSPENTPKNDSIDSSVEENTSFL